MLSNLILILFLISLLICIVLKLNVLIALTIGMILFFAYSVIIGNSFKYTFDLMTKGMMKAKNVIFVFMMIGILTASWRMSGTIAYIIYKIIPYINPSYFILATFLLCSLMSMLIGTSFGSAASMGVICMVIAKSLGINETIVGGAILSGIYLGDRTSPMSSSATLVVALTNTDLYTNIKNMIKSGIIPFLITCAFYFFMGMSKTQNNIDTSILSIFKDNYTLNIMLILPAVIVVVMSLMKIDVKIVMLVSSLCAMAIAFTYQHIDVKEIITMSIFGYKSQSVELGKLMDGGGFMSMVRATILIIISSTYFGIFNETPILDQVKNLIKKVKEKFTLFGAMIFTSILTSVIACNQSLAIMLTYQLTDEIKDDNYSQAEDIENTAVLIPLLIPWNIAGAIPISTVGVTSQACLFAFLAYSIPIYNFIVKIFMKKGDKNEINR